MECVWYILAETAGKCSTVNVGGGRWVVDVLMWYRFVYWIKSMDRKVGSG